MTENEPTTMLHDRQAEEALLGAIILNSEVIDEINIDPGDLYIVRNQYIYHAMRTLHREGQAIDYLTLLEKLNTQGKLEDVGGPSYVTSLINSTPSSLHAQAYAGIIRDLATRREIMRAANDMAKGAFNREKPIDQTITEIMAQVPKMMRVKSGTQHVSVYASRHYDRLSELIQHPQRMTGIPTGYEEYDEITGGLRKGEELLVLGKPGLGKTMWCLGAAFNMARAGYGGAIYEMETGEDVTFDREISRMTDISTDHLETGSMFQEEIPLYTHAIEVLSDPELPLWLSFDVHWTTATLRADLIRRKAENNIEWFVVDYLKFLRDRFGSSETERLNFISGEMKMICRELDLAGVVIHSMNKAGLSAEVPDLNSSSQGADIVFDTDKALFITEHIPDPMQMGGKNPDVRTFLFRKSRTKIKRQQFHMKKLPEFPAFERFPKKG